MSKLVKRVIGEEIDFGPDEFMADDERAPGAGHIPPGDDDQFNAEDFMMGDDSAGKGAPSGDADSLGAEHIETTDEKREVQIANHIMFAAQNGDMQTIIKLAQELHDMHSLGTKY